MSNYNFSNYNQQQNTFASQEQRGAFDVVGGEISERGYNIIIGLVLLWGFGLNYLMATVFSEPILRFFSTTNPLFFLIGYIVCVIVGWILIRKTDSVGSIIGFTLIAAPIGMLLTLTVDGVSPRTIQSSVFATGFVTLVFMALSMFFPDFFLKLGRVLAIALIAMIAGELLSMLIFHYVGGIFDWLVVGLFSLYVGYDWAKANALPKTVNNAIDSAAELYIDIINLFLRLLRIMSRRND